MSSLLKGGSGHTELALAMRESSLVGERVEGVSDGEFLKANLIHYNYRRREEAPVGLEASMVMQWTVNPPSLT